MGQKAREKHIKKAVKHVRTRCEDMYGPGPPLVDWETDPLHESLFYYLVGKMITEDFLKTQCIPGKCYMMIEEEKKELALFKCASITETGDFLGELTISDGTLHSWITDGKDNIKKRIDTVKKKKKKKEAQGKKKKKKKKKKKS